MSTAMMANHDDAFAHLTALFEPGDMISPRLIESWTEAGKKRSKVDYKGPRSFLVGMKNGDGRWHPQPERLKRNIEQTIEQTEANGTSFYFGVCPRFGGGGQYDMAWQTRVVRSLWADVDDTGDPEEVWRRCEKAGLPRPSITVHSGNGVHVYWKLVEPYLIDDAGEPPAVMTEWTEANGKKKTRKYIVGDHRQKLYLDIRVNVPELSEKAQHATDVVHGIAAAIGGDHTFDLSRLLRVAGTLNNKNLRNGAKPVLSRLIECDPERRYGFEVFEQFAERSPAKAEREKVARVKLPKPRKLSGRREDRLEELILQCEAAPVGQRSEADFAVLCFCVEQGIDRAEVWSRVASIGKFAEAGERYFETTWAKAERHTREKLWEKAKAKHSRKTAKTGSNKPATEGSEHVILIDVDESRVVDQAIVALSSLKQVYQRAGGLCHIVTNAPPPPGIARAKDAPRIVQLPSPRLREYLADAATWLSPGSGDNEGGPTHPPDWLVRAVDARGEWRNIPPIESVIECPVIRADGSVVQTPGYDAASGLFYRPMIDFPEIPAKPSQDDARNAADALLEVTEDFPFGSSFHRAGWLSTVLTPLARFAFHGPAPLHLIDSNTRGTGKGLLTDTAGMIVHGRPTPRMTAPGTDDEFRKRITSIAIAAESLVDIDNIEGALGCPALDAALTAVSWSDRILGRSEMVTLPLTTVWMATGNNVQMQADTARRTLHVRLESPEERPEERTGFRHVKLLDWIQQERPRLVAAALTILSGYCVAGRPKMGLKPWGSFDAWTDLVRSAITWAGVDDPGETRTELNATADNEANALRRLIEGWAALDEDGNGLTVASVVDAIEWRLKQDTALPQAYATIRDAITELVPSRGNQFPSARSIGMRLKKFRHRVVGGQYLDMRSDHNGNYWLVRGTRENG